MIHFKCSHKLNPNVEKVNGAAEVSAAEVEE